MIFNPAVEMIMSVVRDAGHLFLVFTPLCLQIVLRERRLGVVGSGARTKWPLQVFKDKDKQN